ncbi:MAG: endonuclease/exonuclease/phosphatase family protein [Actinomycetes bacterium]
MVTTSRPGSATGHGRTRDRRSWDTVRPPRRGQAFCLVAGLFALPFGVLAALLRLFPSREDGPALLGSFIPYGLLATAVALAFFTVATLRARRRTALVLVATATAVLLALQLYWQAPRFLPDRRPVTTGPFEVVSLNIKAGGADPDQLLATATSADIVVLVETTPLAAQALESRGWRQRFPYVAGDPLERGSGGAIYSRFPLRDPAPLPPTSFPMWAATAEVPEVGPVRVIAAHPCNPFCGQGRWAAEHDLLGAAIASSPGDLPLVVAGDFNAVDDHGPLLALRRAGLSSANDLAGAGWQPTYPADTGLPPLLPIDHVFVDDQLTALSVGRFSVAGTDHLGLRAELAGTR